MTNEEFENMTVEEYLRTRDTEELVRCPICRGYGYASEKDLKEWQYRCDACYGTGYYTVDWQEFKCEKCHGTGKKTLTNAEAIRAMTDEQLAEWLDNLMKHCYNCGMGDEQASRDCPVGCNINKWLKEPHEEHK